MPVQKQVFHMEPRMTIAGGLNRHITRQHFVEVDGVVHVETWVPANADPDRTAKNVELVSRKFTNSNGKTYELTLQQAVDKRIREAGIKRKKTQYSCLEVIFTGSRETMCGMSRKKLLKWSKEILTWAQEKWGKENVVSASLHVDERTPHIHMIVVPIVTGQSRRTKFHQEHKKPKKTYKIDHNKPRLCKNEVYTTGKLFEYHDSLYEEVNKNYGLARGTKAEPGSKVRHQDSEDYNRQLAEEAAEQRDLIAEIQADYADIQKNVQELQTQKDTLSSAVKEEQKKFDTAKAKAKEAEEGAKNAEGKLTELEEKKTGFEQEITQLQTQKDTLSSAVKEEQKKFDTAEAKTKKAEDRLTTQQERIQKNNEIINNQVADFNARKETIEEQKKTIKANEATIKEQEKIKSSTVISDDAAEEKILEKLQTVEGLTERERYLRRSIIDKQTELATADANLKRVRAQQEAIVDLSDVPKKGAFGYKTDEVTAFIESVSVARLRQAMNSAPGYVNVDRDIQEENERLRKVEDDYNDFMNSPERLRQQLEVLENAAKLNKITEVLKYVIQDAVKVIRFAIDKATEEMFAKFTIGRNTKEYAAYYSSKPKEKLYYSDEPMNSLTEAKARLPEEIWWGGNLDEIQEKRKKEDTMKRYSTKLGRLTGKDVKITDYLTDGKDYLLSASSGLKYLIQASGKTYSTKDPRVNSIDEAYKLNVWTTLGNINNLPEIEQKFKMKR